MTRVQMQWPVFCVWGRRHHDLTTIAPKDRESRARWLAMRDRPASFRIDHCEVALSGPEKVLHDVKDVERESERS